MKKLPLLVLFAALAAARPACADPADAAARLSRALEEGRAAWQGVRDYEARFVKQESREGRPGPEEEIFFKFEKPFKIFMEWLNTQKKGLQVFYERGKHNGKLAIHKPGLLLGLAPVVFLDQKSPWVREGSASFDIEDAGIGTFLDDLALEVMKAQNLNRLRVQVMQDDGSGLSVRVEFVASKKDEGFMARRVEVFFDAVSKLPVRMALYDADDALIGRYAYEELVLNPGDADAAFRREAHRQLFRLYTGDRG